MTKILPSEWDAPDHLSLSEREFLVDRAETINGIIATSYLQCGQVLLQVKRKFKADPELKGWFERWMKETLPFSDSFGYDLIRVAEQAETNPNVAAAVERVPKTTLFRVLGLPENVKVEVLKVINSGTKFTKAQAEDISKEPEVQLERAHELVEQLEATLLRCTLNGDRQGKYQSKQSLAKALAQLQEKQKVVDGLEKTRSTQELVLAQLQKQLKKKEVQIENMTLDPEQNRKRDLARTVVDATRSLDALLSAFDRYSTDKPELGLEAIQTIERKMAEVKNKLLNTYGATP